MVSGKRKKRATQVQQAEQRRMPSYVWRRRSLLAVLGLALLGLMSRAVHQQIFETDFLQNEGERRHLRVVEIPAYRGMITDRNGEPLAISTPVDSIYANPRLLSPDRHTLAALAGALEQDEDELRQLLARNSGRAFVYLKRRANPDVAQKVMALVRERDIDGVGLERESRRYYPEGEVFAHVVGFTNIDDRGQEGMELAYDEWLLQAAGAKRVIRDGRARVVKDVESIRAPHDGKDLRLSLDRRLQYLAYRELKAAVRQHKARSGSAVILDVRTGEVLAMVNQPSYNPNGSRSGQGGRLRNRALTDVFEPGSTMKPFTVAAALDQGQLKADSAIDTTPGTLRVGRNLVKDNRNYGLIDVATVLRKSSNVGASKIALDLPGEVLWQSFSDLGFGQASAIGFPGEASGQLASFQRWAKIDHATLSFGYGLSVTPMQLAQAYGVLAANGMQRPVSLVRLDEPSPGKRVMGAATAQAVRTMLEAVVSIEGTAPAAAIPGYRVAGKTGTVKKSEAGGYSDDRYIATFAGMVPASDPRLVMAVMINEPSAGKFYGGQVAAPVFAKVMTGAVRLLNIAPDGLDAAGLRLAGGEVHL
jgi:cell division protein FtsI (penicillin-binding protein 3)